MTWPLTFYVKSLPPTVGGEARGPVIRILEKYRNDRGIYEHELVHVKQWAALASLGLIWALACVGADRAQYANLGIFSVGLHGLIYKLIDRYRLWAEVQAYREQAKHYADDRRPLFARFIVESYGLKVTHADVLKLLREH